MKEFWDERYKRQEYVYGKEPNRFLKQKLDFIEPGKILFPAEGEGRNAVYAAKKGWKVSAFDISTVGKQKAERLATAEGVSIDYQTASLNKLGYKKEEFDAIALIYAHFAPVERKDLFKFFTYLLKKKGIIIFEGFGPKHPEYQKMNPAVGGPKEKEMLYSEKEIQAAFPELEFLEYYEGEVDLNVGEFHKGKGWVIRFLGQKKK